MQYLFRVFKVDNKKQIGIGSEEAVFEETYNFIPLVPQIGSALYIPTEWQHYTVIDIAYSYLKEPNKTLIDIFATQEDNE